MTAERDHLREQFNQSKITNALLQQSMVQLTADHTALAAEREATCEQTSKWDERLAATRSQMNYELRLLMAESDAPRKNIVRD